MNKAMTELGQQQYLQTLERSLRIIRSTDRLSLEASIEELCKIQLLKLYFEKKNETSLLQFVDNLRETEEEAKAFYERNFRAYIPDGTFKGWESLYVCKKSFIKVIEDLSEQSLFASEPVDRANAFSEFLQLHYAGYLSEYSSPEVLNKFIDTVLGAESIMSLADPCCGLGGSLVEAVKERHNQIKIKGFDVNQRMVNTANLQLLMYGYNGAAVECKNILESTVAYLDGPFEAVVSHLPVRHRAFSLAGRRYDGEDRMFPRIQEDLFVSQILKMLKPGGFAALVLSDELLQTERREESRRWLLENAQILNITRFEGLAYKSGSNIRAYNVMFLKKREYPSPDICMATLIKENMSDEEILMTAWDIRNNINGVISTSDSHSQYIRLSNEEVWNVNLIFDREKMGSKYSTRQLKELVIPDRQRAKVEDERYYKQLTVKIKGMGVVEREANYVGSTTSKSIRYVAHSGQIIMSALDAEKGATGIVPKELNKALVSRNYYLFTIISPDVDSDYLTMVLSSEPVLRQLAHHKRGYVMSRISMEKILSLVIPLPSLEEQRSLAGKLVRKVKRVMQIQEELEKEQTEFARRLFGEELNVENSRSNMDTNSIVILGNGFDVALGIPTSYSLFYKNSKELRDFAEKGNELCQHIIDNVESDLWSDLEKGLFCYSRAITQKYGVGNQEQADKLEKEFNELRTALFLYLDSVSGTSVELNQQSPVLGLNIEWRELKPQYLTFNYSINTATTADMGQRYILKGNDSINERRFVYQHGSIYDTQTSRNHSPNEIVVGIDPRTQKVEDAHSFLYKTKQNLRDLGTTIRQLAEKSFYVVYGCSVGDSDATYFRTIFNQNQHDKTFLIYGFGEKALNDIRANVQRNCGISIEQLSKLNQVCMLDVQKIETTRKKTQDEIKKYKKAAVEGI